MTKHITSGLIFKKLFNILTHITLLEVIKGSCYDAGGDTGIITLHVTANEYICDLPFKLQMNTFTILFSTLQEFPYRYVRYNSDVLFKLNIPRCPKHNANWVLFKDNPP